MAQWPRPQNGPVTCGHGPRPTRPDRPPGNSRKHILAAVEASLRRLQTDYIDLYQLHGYDPATPIDETLGALDDLVHQGKVRYVGCSNFLTYQLVRAIGRSETLHLARFDSVQPRYNLLFRQTEREMLPFCGEEGVGVIPYNPLAGGLLSGKHSRTAPPAEGTRFTLGNAAGAYQDRYWHDREFDTVDVLRQLAQEAGVSLVTLSVAWVLANKAITAPIIGASRPEQLDSSLAAAGFTLDDDLKRKERRRHEERRPELTGKVDSADGGKFFQLQITLDAGSCPLTRMEVVIRKRQGVAFLGVMGVLSVTSSAETPLRAFTYDEKGKPAGLDPGEKALWPVDVADKHDSTIWVDATCYAEGKGEGEDHWTVAIEAPVTLHGEPSAFVV